jgi:hypothetical protein
MRELLIESSYWITGGIAVTAIVFFVACFPVVKDLCKGIRGKEWALVAMVFLLALFFRLYLAPHTHYVYYDEFVHFEIGNNMCVEHDFYWNPLGVGCNNTEKWLPQWPPGYFFLLSVVYNIFGISETVNFVFVSWIGALSVILTFVLGYLLFEDWILAILISFFMAIYPLHVKFSGCSSLEIISLCFILLSFCCVVIFFSRPRLKTLLCSILVMALTALMRVENLVVLSIASGTCLFFFYHRFRNLKYLLLASGIALLVFLPSTAHFAEAVGIYRGWRESQDAYPFFASLLFWFRGGLQPISVTILSLGGFIWWVRSRRPLALALFVYFLILLSIYALFHKINISIKDMQRFNLQLCPAVIVLAAAGMEWLAKVVPRRQILLLLLVSSIVFTESSLSLDEIERPFSEAAQKQYEFLLTAKDAIHGDPLFFAPVPASITSTIGKRACNSKRLTEPGVKDLTSTASALVLFKDILFSCPDARHLGELAKIRKRFFLNPVVETEVASDRIGFYILDSRPEGT